MVIPRSGLCKNLVEIVFYCIHWFDCCFYSVLYSIKYLVHGHEYTYMYVHTCTILSRCKCTCITNARYECVGIFNRVHLSIKPTVFASSKCVCPTAKGTCSHSLMWHHDRTKLISHQCTLVDLMWLQVPLATVRAMWRYGYDMKVRGAWGEVNAFVGGSHVHHVCEETWMHSHMEMDTFAHGDNCSCMWL